MKVTDLQQLVDASVNSISKSPLLPSVSPPLAILLISTYLQNRAHQYPESSAPQPEARLTNTQERITSFRTGKKLFWMLLRFSWIGKGVGVGWRLICMSCLIMGGVLKRLIREVCLYLLYSSSSLFSIRLRISIYSSSSTLC